MLRPFRSIVCAAVVGFASHGGAISVAPACDHCGVYSGGHANTQYAPPTRVRIRWVSVYEDGQMRLVPRAYRVRVTDPATPSAQASTTPASGAPTSRDLASSAQAASRSSATGSSATRTNTARTRACERIVFESFASNCDACECRAFGSSGSCESRTSPAAGEVRSLPRGTGAGSGPRSSFARHNPQGRRIRAGHYSRPA